MKKIGLRVWKTAVGAILAIILAKALGLQFPYAAPIITLLTIRDTRLNTLDVVRQRFVATAISLVIANVLFFVLGFNVIAFGLYLLLFIPLADKFRSNEGISTSAVLVTHILSEGHQSAGLMVNEVALMLVGTGVAVAVNHYMPKMFRQIANDQEAIDEKFKELIKMLIERIHNDLPGGKEEELLFTEVQNLLEKATAAAQRNRDNYLMFELDYYTSYMEMRALEMELVASMASILDKYHFSKIKADMLEELLRTFLDTFESYDGGVGLMEVAEMAMAEIEEMPLPKTRDELQGHLYLHQFLNEFHHLVEIQEQFLSRLNPESRWKEKALAFREGLSYRERKTLLRNIQRFVHDLKRCYEHQAPASSPQAKELVLEWKQITKDVKDKELFREIKKMTLRKSGITQSHKNDILNYFQEILGSCTQ